jgi:hypothetical protein
MFEWDFNIRLSVGLPDFGKLVETVHDYVWEPEEDE